MDMNIKNLNELNEFENSMLNDKDFFDKYIEYCEESVIAAPENFTSSVMNKIKSKKTAPEKLVSFISRKMAAAVCFCGAAAIMTLTLSGVNGKIFDLISTAALPEKIQQIGEIINTIIKFN